MTREALNHEMRGVLAQLETCSHVPARVYGPSGGGRSSDSPLGGERPPGDEGHVKFARWYGPPFHEPTREHPGSQDDEQRKQVIRFARRELEHLRGHSVRKRPAGETREQRDKRIVKEGEGFTVKEVALRFRCGERDVRRARADAEREPEFGREPEPTADAKARRDRARELERQGLKLAQIARILGVHRSTVERDLGKRGA